MNSILAQSATNLTASTSGFDDYDFAANVARIAALKASGKTVSSHSLNRAKLCSSIGADIRAKYPQLFEEKVQGEPERNKRLPADIWEKVVAAVDNYIESKFKTFKENVSKGEAKVTRRFVHRYGKKDVVIRETMTRDEIIALKEQRTGINIYISETQRVIDKYNNQATVWSEVTEERVRKLEKRIAKERETLQAIDLAIAQQKPAVEAIQPA